MKILLVHNYYGSSAPSGENKVFEAERAMLEKHGHKVAVYVRHSDEIRMGGAIRRLWGMVKGALCTVGNPFAAHEVAKACRAFRPDIVHFHNTFPLISPLAIRAAHRSGAKVVMTLHNYRTVCAAGTPTRGNCVCDACFNKVGKVGGGGQRRLSVLPAIRGRCYRGSLFATLPLALNIWLYRKSWAKWVDRFIVLSEFQKKVMAGCGLPEEKIAVKGNFVSERHSSSTASSKKEQIVYVGRLSAEKGVGTLIRAFKLLNGGGGGVIEFMGLQSKDVVRSIMHESMATVLPSEWWETFGLTVAESMQEGTPVVVSQLGALPEIVK